jgi:hypothetical protein
MEEEKWDFVDALGCQIMADYNRWKEATIFLAGCLAGQEKEGGFKGCGFTPMEVAELDLDLLGQHKGGMR